MTRARAIATPAHLLLALILLAGLLLRLRNIDHGLPHVYNVDESLHFARRAVGMIGWDLNPQYFRNPSALTYLILGALGLAHGSVAGVGPLLALDQGSIVRQFLADPTPIWITARVVTALVCMAGVAGVYFVGKRLWGVREGLVAAAVLAFAFLPVTYSRIAVTDVGTLLPVALAVYGAVRVHERGARRDYLTAGVGVGLTIGFKYTAGLVLLPLLVAATLRIRAEVGSLKDRPAARQLGLGLLAAAIAFAITTPFFFLDPRRAGYGLLVQTEVAGGSAKLGQSEDSAFLYYLDSLTWGLGWAVLAAALIGALIVLRRDRMRGLLLLLFPLALLVFLSLQSRYFGRWMLPAYPVLALLCGVAVVRVASILPIGRVAQALAAAAIAAAVLAQPIVADLHSAGVLGRTDTRESAREFLVEKMPPRLRLAADPGVPDEWYLRRPGGPALPEECAEVENIKRRLPNDPLCSPLAAQQFVAGFLRDAVKDSEEGPGRSVSAYIQNLSPAKIDRYRSAGFCTVITTSVIRERASISNLQGPLAYYRRLEAESELIYSADPWKRGQERVPFHFDLSYNYYPSEYQRPGPEVRIYRLDRCAQRAG